MSEEVEVYLNDVDNENLELGSHSKICFSLTCGWTTSKHGSHIFKPVFYSLANIY
jgi:hypothetical protein